MTENPAVTALCPTYGRAEQLRDAIACFVLQTYRPRWLLVLNDAPEPLRLLPSGNVLKLPGCTVEVWNNPVRYPTLGHKRQALLTAGRSSIVAHWDDDDWYLPWHLEHCTEAWLATDAQMVKPRGAWWVTGSGDRLRVAGPHRNVFEGQLLFERHRATLHGGYAPMNSGEAKALMDRFKAAGEFRLFDPGSRGLSYCYRWDDGLHHISSSADREHFARENRAFARGPLIPGGVDAVRWARQRMTPRWRRLSRQAAAFRPRFEEWAG